MALKALEGVQEIGGFKLIVMDELKEKYPEKFNDGGGMDWKWFEAEIRPENFIYLRKDKNSLSFTIQNGPIKEVGVNGCQVETMARAVVAIYEGLQKEFPCEENKLTIAHFKKGLQYQEQRTADREKRGVEGFNKE